MSALTHREVTAGISRRALETIIRRNGNGNGTEISPLAMPQKSIVLDTWCRQFVILDFDHANFALRDTIHLSDKPETVIFYLSRHELEALVSKAQEVLRMQ